MLGRVLNIPQISNMTGLVTQVSEQNTSSSWMAGLQRVLCKLCCRDSRYSEYTSDFSYTKNLNVSGILIPYFL